MSWWFYVGAVLLGFGIVAAGLALVWVVTEIGFWIQRWFR